MKTCLLPGTALLLALAACTSRYQPTAPAPAAAAEATPAQVGQPSPPLPTPDALVGTRWVLAEVDGVPVGRAHAGAPVTLEFSAGSFGGHSGCNDYGTGYTLDGRRFVTTGMSSTTKRCAPAIDTVETRLFRILGSPFDFDIDSAGNLNIVKEGAAALRFSRVLPHPPLAAPPEPPALVGTRWRLVEADGRAIADATYPPVTLDFGDGTLSGSSGCNAYNGEYRLQGRRFLPRPPIATQRGCGDPVGALERRLFQILGTPFELDSDAEGRLVLVSGGVPVLRFVGR